MQFTESDINFEVIDEHQFEELCFDLLERSGYHSLVWRQGGSDSGRDIEALVTIPNRLIGDYNEKWFFECKHYSRGVPVEQLGSKLFWADAEQPKRLVILTSSYITNQTRDWISKMEARASYSIHVVEGKKLKALILNFQDLITKYFIDKHFKLLLNARQDWELFGSIPERLTVYRFQEIKFERLSTHYAALIWIFWRYQQDDIDIQFKDFLEERPFDDVFDYIIENAVEGEPLWKSFILPDYKPINYKEIFETNYGTCLIANTVLNFDSKVQKRTALYCFDIFEPNRAIEIFIQGGAELVAQIRVIRSQIDTEYEEAKALLSSN